MGITQILVFAGLILAYRLVFKARGRAWVLYGASILAVFWLQPATPIRNLDFWLPLATLAISVLGWTLTQPAAERGGRENWLAGAVLSGIVILVSLTRLLPWEGLLTPTNPPVVWLVLAALAVLAGLAILTARFSRPVNAWLWPALVVLLAALLALKIPAAAEAFSRLLRLVNGQSLERASALDIRWLGFSYVAFRLAATLRDRQNGRLPAMSLREYVTYVIFFPAFTAGPIDRPERFLKDLRADAPFNAEEALAGGERLAGGIFAKFVLADALAFIALNPANAEQIHSAGWLWMAVLAYALRIYFDFSGYTSIAIGLARWLGVKLPENFNHPYRKPNLTQFWNNWHITLTQWFRAYYFNPLTRALRGKHKNWPPALIIFITQVTTMLLIGLWHGGTWNFIVWGLWHGLGQFVQNRYSEKTRAWVTALDAKPGAKRAYTAASTLLTFLFVSLGWIWFVLDTPQQALRVFAGLLGLG